MILPNPMCMEREMSMRPMSVLRTGIGGCGMAAKASDGHDRIHLAESRDGLTWEKRGVVLEDKDANHVNDPSVVRVGNEW